ncbi:10446_t:CDS:1, partial [Dentiscutata heterogama]
MPPTISAIKRARQREFSDDFYTSSTQLFCRFCNKSIDFTKHSTLKNHQQFAKHIHQKETQLNRLASRSSSTIPRQTTLP